MTDSTMTKSALLALNDVRVDFAGKDGPVRAVDGVSFAVGKGEIVALVGESGSGKSASANAIMGLLPATVTVQGSIRLGDRELVGLDDAQFRGVRGFQAAMVFQDPSTALNPVETVGWQIAEAMRAHKNVRRRQARTRAKELLELVGIPDAGRRVDYYPHQLSGGQKQRVVIALALVNEPRLLIADEPTTALDVTVQAEILKLLRELRDRLGMSVLLITHNMGVVADLADRVVVLRDGRIVETGEVHDLFARPRVAYTQELLAAVPRLDPSEGSPNTESAERPAEADAVDFTSIVVDYPGRFGAKPFRAIENATLSVRRGEVLGLVGESGSGKSTLGQVAVGVLHPTNGTARVLGEVPAQLRRRDLRRLRRRIGMVFQDPIASLDPRLTIGDSIAEPFRVHGLGSERGIPAELAELFELVQLSSRLADRRPAELSGGQRQRAALARALALRPELLIADEPTSALDVSVQAAVLDLFAELQRELKFACLFISHDLAVVDRVANRIAVLREGLVVESGDPSVVLRRPAEAYTRTLIDSVPIPDPVAQRRRRIPHQVGRVTADGVL